jgi:hypothetical protein
MQKLPISSFIQRESAALSINSFEFCIKKFLFIAYFPWLQLYFLLYRKQVIFLKNNIVFAFFAYCTFYLQIDTFVKLWICVDLALVDPLVLLGHVPMCTSTPIVYSEARVAKNISRIFATEC